MNGKKVEVCSQKVVNSRMAEDVACGNDINTVVIVFHIIRGNIGVPSEKMSLINAIPDGNNASISRRRRSLSMKSGLLPVKCMVPRCLKVLACLCVVVMVSLRGCTFCMGPRGK